MTTSLKIDFVSNVSCPWCAIGLKSLDQALERMAGEVGLDTVRAREILATEAYAEEVRQRESFYLSQGIHSVPAVIINGRHLISGGQPAEVFEQALRQIAAAG